MESELWSDIRTERPYGYNIVFVDNYKNWRCYDEIYEDEIRELIDSGFTKWCYVADLVRVTYDM